MRLSVLAIIISSTLGALFGTAHGVGADLAASDGTSENPSQADPFDEWVQSQVPQHLFVIEVFTLPKTAFFEMEADRDDDDAAYRERLLDQVETGAAELSKLLAARGIGREEIRVTQGADLLFGTNIDPPEVPAALVIAPGGGPPRETVNMHRVPRGPANAGLGTISTATPMDAEVRTLDTTVKISALAHRGLAGSEIELSMERCRFTGMQRSNSIDQPAFDTAELDQRLTLHPGQPRCLGTFGGNARFGVGRESIDGVEVQAVAFCTMVSRPGPLEAGLDAAAAQEAPPRKVRSRVEVVSMAPKSALTLLRQDFGDAPVYQQLQKAIASGDAEMESVLIARGSSEKAFSIESQDELIYPVKYDPPELPSRLIIANRELLDAMRQGRETDAGLGPARGASAAVGGFGTISSLSPTAFVMQPLGTSMNLKVTQKSAGFEAEVKLAVTHEAGQTFISDLAHPLTSQQFLTTTVRGQWGERMLLGTLNPPHDVGVTLANDTGRIWLAFLTVEADPLNP